MASLISGAIGNVSFGHINVVNGVYMYKVTGQSARDSKAGNDIFKRSRGDFCIFVFQQWLVFTHTAIAADVRNQ
jgi:hypothetical protein